MMRSQFGLSVLALCFFALVGCRAPRVQSQAIETTSPSDVVAQRSSNTFGPGDLLEVRVFQEADLSGAFRISPEGTVDYPLCGKVVVSGKTSSETADILVACLTKGYLKSPQVTVLPREYNSKKIFVFGQVQKPGTFPYDEGMNIVQAITLAGGFTRQAAGNSTFVTRKFDNTERKMRVAVEDIGVGREKNFALSPGDIIYVPESFF